MGGRGGGGRGKGGAAATIKTQAMSDLEARNLVMTSALAVNPALVSGDIVTMQKVRTESGLDKETFDKAVISLAQQKKIFLSWDDHAHVVSPEKRATMVKDPTVKDSYGRDKYYSAISFPRK